MRETPAGSGQPGVDPEELPEPPTLRRLRLLVSTLMVALILGILSVAAVLVIRLGGIAPAAAPVPELTPIAADALRLPAGAEVQAIGRAGGEILVLSRDSDGVERLRAFDAESGAARSVTEVVRD